MIVLFLLNVILQTNNACMFYPQMIDFKEMGLLGDTFEYKKYWKLPKVKLEDAEEEAVMLIGGSIN